MTVELVTGFSGAEHVTSGQDGARQAGTVGTGKYVLMTNDDPLAATLENANTVTVGPGDVLINGRHVQLTGSTTFSIPVGTQAQQTSNLLVIRYSRDDSGVEKAEALTLTGDPAASDPQDPALATGSILDGDTPVDMPLYRVITTGIETAQPVKLFSTLAPLIELPGASGEPLPIANGGTGATTADGALENLGAFGIDDWNEALASSTGIFKANRGMVNSANWETLYNLAPGSYILSNSATNSPVPGYYANMTVSRAGGNRVSILAVFDNGQVWTIMGAQTASGAVTTWIQLPTTGRFTFRDSDLLWSGNASYGGALSFPVSTAMRYKVFAVQTSYAQNIFIPCMVNPLTSSTDICGSVVAPNSQAASNNTMYYLIGVTLKQNGSSFKGYAVTREIYTSSIGGAAIANITRIYGVI